jgi:hypothetical protein
MTTVELPMASQLFPSESNKQHGGKQRRVVQVPPAKTTLKATNLKLASAVAARAHSKNNN